MNIPLHSIYRASEGEGLWAGRAQVFVRLQGCAVGCANCDSKETWEFKSSGFPMQWVLEEIEKKRTGIKVISITGGDPLHPKILPATMALSRELKSKGFYVHLEAAGTRVVDELFDFIDFISFDIKTPSTQISTPYSLLEKMVEHYFARTQIKAVVAHEEDFNYVYAIYKKLEAKYSSLPPMFLTPCWEQGAERPMELVKTMQRMNEECGGPFRILLQQHKIIFGTQTLEV